MLSLFRIFYHKVNEIVLRTMKSSLCSDEIFGVPPQMKLNPPRPSPREAGFHREAISSTKGGFLPPAADLTEKSRLLSQSAFFLAGAEGFEPTTNGFGDRDSTS